MNVALFVLRALQAGLTLSDLDQLDEGMVSDIIIEAGNDHEHYDDVATQEAFDRF